MTRVSCFFLTAAISFLAGQSFCSLVDTDALVPGVVTNLAPVPLVGGLIDNLLESSQPDTSDANFKAMGTPGQPTTQHKQALGRSNRSLRRRQRTMVLGILDDLSAPSASTAMAPESNVFSQPARHKQALPATATVSAVLSQLQSARKEYIDASGSVASSVPGVTPRPASLPASLPAVKSLPPAPAVVIQPITDHPVDDTAVVAHVVAEDAAPPVHVLPSFLNSNMPGISTIPVKSRSSQASKVPRTKRHVPIHTFSGITFTPTTPLIISPIPFIPSAPAISSIPAIHSIPSIPSAPTIPFFSRWFY